MLCRPIKLPVDIMFGGVQSATDPVTYVDRTTEIMNNVYQAARKHLQFVSEHQKSYYDAKAQAKQYEAGDLVWLHNVRRRKGRSPKLQRPWDGPYKISKRLSDVAYRVKKRNGKPRVVHFNRLKMYHGTDCQERDDAQPVRPERQPPSGGDDTALPPSQPTPDRCHDQSNEGSSEDANETGDTDNIWSDETDSRSGCPQPTAAPGNDDLRRSKRRKRDMSPRFRDNFVSTKHDSRLLANNYLCLTFMLFCL